MAWLSTVDPNLLVFIDETGAKTNMTRAYGRAKAGERVHDSNPHGHWNTSTLLAGLSLGGPLAPILLDGPMDRLCFEAYLEQFLIPELPQGATLIMDNFSAHKSPKVSMLLEAEGCQLAYLPPYSPDLNPIEQMWSKVKSHLKGAKARTQKALCQAIKEALAEVTAQDAEGFFLDSFVGVII